MFLINHLKLHYSVYESIRACCLDPQSNFTYSGISACRFKIHDYFEYGFSLAVSMREQVVICMPYLGKKSPIRFKDEMQNNSFL